MSYRCHICHACYMERNLLQAIHIIEADEAKAAAYVIDKC